MLWDWWYAEVVFRAGAHGSRSRYRWYFQSVFSVVRRCRTVGRLWRFCAVWSALHDFLRGLQKPAAQRERLKTSIWDHNAQFYRMNSFSAPLCDSLLMKKNVCFQKCCFRIYHLWPWMMKHYLMWCYNVCVCVCKDYWSCSLVYLQYIHFKNNIENLTVKIIIKYLTCALRCCLKQNKKIDLKCTLK